MYHLFWGLVLFNSCDQMLLIVCDKSYRIDELYEFANEINVYELQDLSGFITFRIIYRLTAIAIVVPPSQSHSLPCF